MNIFRTWSECKSAVSVVSRGQRKKRGGVCLKMARLMIKARKLKRDIQDMYNIQDIPIKFVPVQ